MVKSNPKCITDGSLGVYPTAAGQFLWFFQKNSIFYAVWMPFYTFLQPYEITELLAFGIRSVPIFTIHSDPLFSGKSKTCLKACKDGQSFLSDLAKMGASAIPFFTIAP